MLKILLARAAAGPPHRRVSRREPPTLPDRFRGRPVLDADEVPGRLPRVRRGVPDRRARSADAGGLALDLGRCLFCTDCVEACPEGAIASLADYRLATRDARGSGRRAGTVRARARAALDEQAAPALRPLAQARVR